MYKALEQSIRSSEKHAELGDFAFRVWTLGLAAADIVGRLTASPKKFHAEAMPMGQYDEVKLLEAFNELKATRLVHFYEVEGKRFMVFHDHEEYNKGTKNLKYQLRSKLPPPSPSLCFCVVYTKEEETVTADQSADVSAVASAAVHVHVPVSGSLPTLEPKESVRFLATKWNKGPGLHLNGDKACQHIQAAVDVGVDPQAIDKRFSDHPAIKGLHIWEGLEPLRPRGGIQIPTMDEIIKSASKVGAK